MTNSGQPGVNPSACGCWTNSELFLPDPCLPSIICHHRRSLPTSTSSHLYATSYSMANSRPVTEIPRFLLPRLTWSTLPAKSPVKPTIKAFHQIPIAAGFQSSTTARSHHTINNNSHSSHHRQRRNSTGSPSSLNRRTYTINPPSATTALAPVRHNGVYASIFKPAQRAFSTTPPTRKSHHFDTLKFVQRLKSEGFNEAQATAMMRVLNDVIEESIQNLTRTMVLKEDAERTTYTQKVDFAKLRSELSNADSSEIQLTRASHEKLTSDLAKLGSRLRDEIGRTQASVRLDLNLEKGRIREEANTQEMRIQETKARIEQEVAGLRERVEAVKFSTLQWLMYVLTLPSVVFVRRSCGLLLTLLIGVFAPVLRL